MAKAPYGLPRPGSTAWAAKRVERILDREAKERRTELRRRWADDAKPIKVRDHPIGSDAWAAQQIRLIRQHEARTKLGLDPTRANPPRMGTVGAARTTGVPSSQPALAPSFMRSGPVAGGHDFLRPAVGSAFSGAPPGAGLLSAYASPDRAAVARGWTAAPPPGAARVIPAAAVLAPALPWIVGQAPSWLGALAPLLGLAPLLRGDTPEEDDYCYRRWQEELSRCSRWPEKWLHGCRGRANARHNMCVRNGGRPDPGEPAEWGEEDMEVWYNPDR